MSVRVERMNDRRYPYYAAQSALAETERAFGKISDVRAARSE